MIFNKRIKIYILVAVFYVCVLMFFPADHWDGPGITEHVDTTLYEKIINRTYFVTTTLSTAGYGDIAPKTLSLKLITMTLQICIILGVFDLLISRS